MEANLHVALTQGYEVKIKIINSREAFIIS